MTQAALLLLLAAAATGCGSFGAPSPTPGGFSELVAALVSRGAAITDQVAGDAGCSDPTLVGNAVRFDVRMPGSAASVPVFTFRWRRAADYQAAAGSFGQCVAAFGGAHPGATITAIEASPWRAFGLDWSSVLEETVRDALHEAGGR
jgi:hypothetical protein